MALGVANIKLTLSDKEFQNSLTKAQAKFKSSIDGFKNILVGAAIGQYLMTGANEAIDAAVKQMTAKLNFIEQGLNDMQITQIQSMSEQFELLGFNAEQAGLKIAEFVIQGKATGLKEIGILLDKQTIATLKTATTQERLNFVMSQFPQYLEGMKDTLPEGVQQALEFKKTMDDLRESLGMVFLNTIQSITDAFGGVAPAMKAALIAFLAYKSAMIIGNIAIGISKAIAMGSVWSAVPAFAIGAASLAALGVAGGLVMKGISNIESANNAPVSSSTTTTPETQTVVVIKDQFGEVQQSLSKSSGGVSSTVQTNYGSK